MYAWTTAEITAQIVVLLKFHQNGESIYPTVEVSLGINENGESIYPTVWGKLRNKVKWRKVKRVTATTKKKKKKLRRSKLSQNRC